MLVYDVEVLDVLILDPDVKKRHARTCHGGGRPRPWSWSGSRGSRAPSVTEVVERLLGALPVGTRSTVSEAVRPKKNGSKTAEG